jgi:hypothetical protein
MARRIAILLLLLAAATQGASLKYVGPVANGTGAGTSWTNRAKADSTWFRTVAAGDTVLFYPGTYDSCLIIPPERVTGLFTRYWAGDGVTNQPYDPGVASLGANPTRLEFEQSLLVPKVCTLTAARKINAGATWTNYSGNVYSFSPIDIISPSGLDNRVAVSCVQDTTQLDPVMEGAIPTSAGSVSYNLSTRTLYVWTTDGSNPTTHNFLLSRQPIFNMAGGNNTGYFQVFGFDLQCFNYGAVYTGGTPGSARDSAFLDHCRVTKGVAEAGSNEGAMANFVSAVRSTCGGTYECTYQYDKKYCRIRSCYVAQIWEPGRDVGRVNILTTYNMSHTYVESCFAVGIGGVDWKNQAEGGLSYGNVMRFCTIKHWPATAYENLCGLNWYDSCYGNVFIGDPTNGDMKAVWFRFTYLGGNTSRGRYHFVANNTFYQCEKALATGVFSHYEWPPNYIKYNIFVGGGRAASSQYHLSNTNDTNFVTDSNLYYLLPTNHFNRDGANVPLSTWQTYQSGVWAGSVYHDIHSVTYNPNFIAAGTDFRRSSPPAEMDVTYGGKRWTSFGAEGASSAVGENPIFKTKASGSISVPNGAGGIQWR